MIDCWNADFTPAFCCFSLWGPSGNQMCWGQALNFERCCAAWDDAAILAYSSLEKVWSGGLQFDLFRAHWDFSCEKSESFSVAGRVWTTELNYWYNVLRSQQVELQRPASLQALLDMELVRAQGMIERSEVLIVDVGSGPISRLGRSTSWGAAVKVLAVDPLACQYKHLLKHVRSQTDEHCEHLIGGVEVLPRILAGRRFDAIFALNSLDHAQDPVSGILQMFACAKDGQPVIFYVHRNEATKTGGRGLHRWDFDISRVTDDSPGHKTNAFANMVWHLTVREYRSTNTTDVSALLIHRGALVSVYVQPPAIEFGYDYNDRDALLLVHFRHNPLDRLFPNK